ncbi:SDR family NAD(P)-dependent oxidoreductase [Halomonas sp. PR-M31]|uniref:SDR family NAD(P)-dependent oxidoreductase n=1 Tax=Halomonas sp. PR-M31 TaxID=1471202 RepID=UPI0006518407|nr:SDR family NAD(P)-dependent oxidoreductase [Halomonas sp. PR-M31]
MQAASQRLKDKVCVVTGASRGVGRGIALALGREGATVYVTGRTLEEGQAPLPGTVGATAEAVTQAGGQGIAVACDHADDAQVEALFQRIAAEQGQLDILVNNALTVPDALVRPGSFWEKPLDMTALLDVGLRSSYVSSYYAAPLMIKRGGLIVFTSAPGARCYMHGPAYGAGKAGVDKMAFDMAHELRPYNVATISLWLGVVATERTQAVLGAEPEKYGPVVPESVEFAGRVLTALYADSKRLERSGQVHYAAELAREYGVTDLDGSQPPSYRDALGGPVAYSAAVVE